MKAQVLIAGSIILFACSAPCPAQDQERFNFLFERFTEIGKRAEQIGEFQTACGMYEAALENTSFSTAQKPKYVETLASIIRCYLSNGYHWRVKPFMDKLLPALEEDPKLVSATVQEVLTNYSALLVGLGKENDARTFQNVCEKLVAKRALATQAQEN